MLFQSRAARSVGRSGEVISPHRLAASGLPQTWPSRARASCRSGAGSNRAGRRRPGPRLSTRQPGKHVRVNAIKGTRKEEGMLLAIGIVLLIIAIAGGAIIHPIL